MNTKILLSAIGIIALSSCSSAYKVTQTPDDVYYSPGTDGDYVAPSDNQQTYNNTAIVMSIRDPRWRDFDDDYSYTPYAYGYNADYYYNPYYCSYPVYNPVVVTPTNPVNTTPRMTNLSAYKSGYNNSNQAVKMDKQNAQQQQKIYNNNNNPGTTFGNLVRQVFAPTSNDNNTNNTNYNNNNYNNTNNTNNTNTSDRNYAPASSGSSSSGGSSSSSGGGGEVSRPARN
jgi:uncharacterized membrane protein YgcG